EVSGSIKFQFTTPIVSHPLAQDQGGRPHSCVMIECYGHDGGADVQDHLQRPGDDRLRHAPRPVRPRGRRGRGAQPLCHAGSHLVHLGTGRVGYRCCRSRPPATPAKKDSPGAHLLFVKRRHRGERIFMDPKARSAIVHLFAYLAVVLLLFAVNYTETPKVWWFYWVALRWGAGFAAHLWCVFYKHGRGRSRTGMVATSGASQATPARPSSSGSKSRTRNATPHY